MLFEQLRQLRMIFQFACFENHQLVHGPIKHRDAIVAGEPRRIDESVDITMFLIHCAPERLAGSQMSGMRGVGWRTDFHATRSTKVE